MLSLHKVTFVLITLALFLLFTIFTQCLNSRVIEILKFTISHIIRYHYKFSMLLWNRMWSFVLCMTYRVQTDWRVAQTYFHIRHIWICSRDLTVLGIVSFIVQDVFTSSLNYNCYTTTKTFGIGYSNIVATQVYLRSDLFLLVFLNKGWLRLCSQLMRTFGWQSFLSIKGLNRT